MNTLLIANVIWPSLYLVRHLNIWWVVISSLLLEFLCLRFLVSGPIWKIGVMTLVMNLGSALVGLIAIPGLGLAWELIASVSINPLFQWGTFNPLSWIVSGILAVLINAVIEMLILSWIFKIHWTRKFFAWLLVANGLTVGLAYGSILMNPPTI